MVSRLCSVNFVRVLLIDMLEDGNDSFGERGRRVEIAVSLLIVL